MTGVRFEITGKEEALAALSDAVARLEHPAPMFDKIGAALVVSTKNRFEAEQDPDGNPWPMSIRVLVEGGKTLTDTARLKNSITHEASDSGVAVGTNVVYAATHQFGARIKAKTAKGLRFRLAGANSDIFVQAVTIPRRAFLGLDADDEREIAAIAGDYISAPLGGEDAH